VKILFGIIQVLYYCIIDIISIGLSRTPGRPCDPPRRATKEAKGCTVTRKYSTGSRKG